MIITEQNENSDFYNFTFDNGVEQSVGKKTNFNPEGAANYEEAIEMLKLNFPDLEL